MDGRTLSAARVVDEAVGDPQLPAFGLADVAYLPWLLRLRDLLGVTLEPYPEIERWVADCSERPSVAAEIDTALRRSGFERPAFDTIVASGPNAALPHARAGERQIAEGDLVVLDFGGVLDGYCTDISRTVVAGRAGERVVRPRGLAIGIGLEPGVGGEVSMCPRCLAAAVVALLVVTVFGRSTLGLGYSIFLTDALIAPAFPSNTARGGVLYPIILSLAQANGSKPDDAGTRRLGAYLMFCGMASLSVSSALWLTATSANPLGVSLVAQRGLKIGFSTWLLASSVPTLAAILLLMHALAWL